MLAARLTTSPKPALPSVVELPNETLTGRVVCDDIVALYRNEIRGVATALSPPALVAINRGLALSVPIGGGGLRRPGVYRW